jgi:hypothetical protein
MEIKEEKTREKTQRDFQLQNQILDFGRFAYLLIICQDIPLTQTN